MISVNQAANLIGVSTATLRNWVKCGDISPLSSKPLVFSEENLAVLKHKIGTDAFARLKSRANKAAASHHFLPEEYADNLVLLRHMSELLSFIQAHQLSAEAVIFLAALKLLVINNEVDVCDLDRLFNIGCDRHWRRHSVKTIMTHWQTILAKLDDYPAYREFYALLAPQNELDFLGLLYQGLFKVGNKSKQGAYYTPSKLVNEALVEMPEGINTFLDPCCGTGKYLLIAARHFNLKLENIYGFDCDSLAIQIARLNLLLAYQHCDFTPNVFCLDSLSELAIESLNPKTNSLLGQIDLIATNPPWGADKNRQSKKNSATQIKSGETFSLFLEKSIKLLKPGGRLSFILPESILKIKTHADIRKMILAETCILKITPLGKPFTGVFSRVIRLDLIKQVAIPDWQITVADAGVEHPILQQRFLNNEYYLFDINIDSAAERLLAKIYATPHITLAEHAQWALGIVTGHNQKYISDMPNSASEPVYRGSNVRPYCLGQAHSFMTFTPHLYQQVAAEKYYRAAEKLIYKFISNKLVFAYDKQQVLTLNSANILIPAIPQMRIKVVLAFLNSALFQYIFAKRFATHKVLRRDLERLPFPIIDETMQQKIEERVNALIVDSTQQAELDELIFRIFSLTEEDVVLLKKG